MFGILSGVRWESDLGPIASPLEEEEAIVEVEQLGATHSFSVLTMETLKSHTKEIPQAVANPKTYKEAAYNFMVAMDNLYSEDVRLFERSDQQRINDLYSAFETILGDDVLRYRLIFGFDN